MLDTWSKPPAEVEVTKQQFKDYYFQYATPDSGWTQDYWNNSFEKEEGKQYFFTPPATAASTSMFVTADANKRRLYFLTDEATESFFDFPGKN